MRRMTRDEIVALVDRRTAAWAAHDAAGLAAIHAVNGVVVSPTGGVLEGREEIERVYRLWLTAFPDITVQSSDLLIDGDRVAQVMRISGTHLGDFFGMPPTNRRVELEAALLVTVRDGLIVEERRVYDFTGLVVQVGVLKAKPTA